MKELKKYFEHYKTIYPDLSSFMWFVKVVKHTNPNKRNLRKGFNELVEKSDYSPSDREQLIAWLSEKPLSK